MATEIKMPTRIDQIIPATVKTWAVFNHTINRTDPETKERYRSTVKTATQERVVAWGLANGEVQPLILGEGGLVIATEDEDFTTLVHTHNYASEGNEESRYWVAEELKERKEAREKEEPHRLGVRRGSSTT